VEVHGIGRGDLKLCCLADPQVIADIEDFQSDQFEVLKPGFRNPNKPAAVCLSNRATVHLKCGRVKEALSDAQEAIQLCPMYVKAHYRYAQALEQQGDKASKKKAAETLKRIKEHTLVCGLGQFWDACAALTVGWMDMDNFMFNLERVREDIIWNRIIQDHEAKYVAGPLSPAVSFIFSLVPMMGGQWLTMSVKYRCDDPPSVPQEVPGVIRFDLMHLMILDVKHGDDLERRPHGHPSAMSRKSAPGHIARLLSQAVERGIIIETDSFTSMFGCGIMLGQGLTGMVQVIEATIEREAPEVAALRSHQAHSVWVYPSISTAASTGSWQ